MLFMLLWQLMKPKDKENGKENDANGKHRSSSSRPPNVRAHCTMGESSRTGTRAQRGSVATLPRQRTRTERSR